MSVPLQIKNKMADKAETIVAFFARFFTDIVNSPLNIALVGVCIFLLYKIIGARRHPPPLTPSDPPLPRMKKRDFTLEQLREYDGRGSDGRIVVAVNGKVFDVTKGKKFYGPGGPYGVFAGRDASRGLATFSLEDAIKETYDDLSDLNSMQMDSVREWEMQFTEKYEFVGRLLKPCEEPHEYTDDEETSTTDIKCSKDD